VVGYGAPGQRQHAPQLLAGIRRFIDYTVDRNPYKQGKFLPGTHIPSCTPTRSRKPRPDICHLAVEFQGRDHGAKCRGIREWGDSWSYRFRSDGLPVKSNLQPTVAVRAEGESR